MNGRRFAAWGSAAVAVLGAVAAGYRRDLPAAEVERHYADAASRFRDVDGLRVHFKDEGEGPTAVLLHGFGAALDTWDGWVRELAGRAGRSGLRLVRLDLPGFGLTGPWPAGPYATSRYVGFLGSFLDALGIGRAHLVGSSMGGHLAWRFAAAHPERVERLVLVDSAGYPGRERRPVLRLGRIPGVRILATRLTPRALVVKALRDVYADDRRITDELVERRYRLLLRAGNRAALIARSAAMGKDLGTAAIRQVRSPTLVLWGRQDRWIPVDRADRFHRDLPDSELVIYDDLGHVPMEEDPVPTAADARRFLLAGGPTAA